MKINFKELSRKITKNYEDALEKAKALYWFVKEEIKYKITIVGDPEKILKLRYGSCIDKTILFVKLAREIGLKARYHVVLVDIRPLLGKFALGKLLSGIDNFPLLPHTYPEVFVKGKWVPLDGPSLDYDLERVFPGGLLRALSQKGKEYIKDIGTFNSLQEVLSFPYIKELFSLFEERADDVYNLLQKVNKYLFNLRSNKLDFLKKERPPEEFKEDIERLKNLKI